MARPSTSQWLRQAPTGRERLPVDPASRALAQEVTDLRNLTLRKHLHEELNPAPARDANLDAVLKPVLESVGRQIAERVAATGQAPSQDETDRMLDRTLNRLTKSTVIRQLSQGQDPTAAAPGPTTAQQFTEMTRAAVEIHRGAAETALHQAEDERQRRIEAENDVGGAVEAAVAREEARNDFILKLFQTQSASELQRERDLAQLRLEVAQANKDAALAEINRKIDQVIGTYERQIQGLEARHASETARIAAEHVKDLKIAELTHQYDLVSKMVPRADTPQDIVNRAWAEAQSAKLRDDAETEKALNTERIQTQQQFTELLKKGVEVLPDAAVGLLQGIPNRRMPLGATPPGDAPRSTSGPQMMQTAPASSAVVSVPEDAEDPFHG